MLLHYAVVMVTPAQTAAATGGVDRRTQLIEAANALFTERSYDEVTTVEIAKRAGVAYGLIAHYFTNKRGLYLATVTSLAEGLDAVNAANPVGNTPAALLRCALTRNIAHIEKNDQGFRALMCGGVGADPEVRALIEGFRWQGAGRLLRALGATEPISPALRTAMRGWVNFVADSIMDHLRHRELTRNDLVDLAIATLVAALRTAHAIDPRTGIEPVLIDQLATTESTNDPRGVTRHEVKS
jgi:AcrR family transcriptional regulator